MQTIRKYAGRALLLMAAWGVLPVQAQPDSLSAVSTPAVQMEVVAPEALWDKANTAYINGDYHEAVAAYGEILDQGLVSAKLYYNLGNAYYKEGELGKAILFYRRALRLRPGNEDVRYNLEVAESRTKDKIEEIPEFFAVAWFKGVRHAMGSTAWSVLSLVFWAVMLALLLVFLLAPNLAWRKAGFYGTVAAFVLCVIATWFAAYERREMLRCDEAVVMAVSSAVKSSPDRASTDLFLLHEGTKVRVSGRLDGWAEIVLADGKKGWIEEGKVEMI